MNLTDPIFSMAYNRRWALASKKAFKWTGVSLLIVVWLSILLFCVYILAVYLSAMLRQEPENWNETLPGLYERGARGAAAGMGLHFLSGVIILLLGSVELTGLLRYRFPVLRRWLARTYIFFSLLTATGGLFFIALKGTIGGLVMDVGLAIYGMLLFIAAVETYRYDVKGRFADQQVWALRLYALVIGSWLYRMYYCLWLLLTSGAGHTDSFNGAFDYVMAFFFYLPNLFVVEIFIRARHLHLHPAVRLTACLPLLGAACLLLVSTWYVTLYCWGPAILHSLWWK